MTTSIGLILTARVGESTPAEPASTPPALRVPASLLACPWRDGASSRIDFEMTDAAKSPAENPEQPPAGQAFSRLANTFQGTLDSLRDLVHLTPELTNLRAEPPAIIKALGEKLSDEDFERILTAVNAVDAYLDDQLSDETGRPDAEGARLLQGVFETAREVLDDEAFLDFIASFEEVRSRAERQPPALCCRWPLAHLKLSRPA